MFSKFTIAILVLFFIINFIILVTTSKYQFNKGYQLAIREIRQDETWMLYYDTLHSRYDHGWILVAGQPSRGSIRWIEGYGPTFEDKKLMFVSVESIPYPKSNQTP